MTGSSPRPETFAIEAQKIRSYLLNPAHPVGGSKARFFIGWGFDADQPAVFTRALMAHALPYNLASIEPFPWGVKHVFEGPLESPRGRTPPIRSIWTVRPNTAVGVLSSADPI